MRRISIIYADTGTQLGDLSDEQLAQDIAKRKHKRDDVNRYWYHMLEAEKARRALANNYNELGAMRRAAGLTLAKLSELSGMNLHVIHGYERGIRTPSAKALERILSALKPFGVVKETQEQKGDTNEQGHQ